MLSRRSLFGAMLTAPVAAIGAARAAAAPPVVVRVHTADIVSNADDAKAVARAVAAMWNQNPSLRPNY